MSQEVFCLSFPPGDPGGDNKQLFVLKAPSDTHGGGITLVAASAVNGAAYTAANGGTSFSLILHKYSSAGTPAVNGTISTNTLGGTANGWAAGVPQNFTLDTAYTFIDAGEWVTVQYGEQNAGNPTNATILLQYMMGRQ